MSLMAILSLVTLVSEGAASITQILFPNNKGVSGVLSTVIKVVQAISGKKTSS